MLDLLGAGRNDVGRIVGDTPKLKKKKHFNDSDGCHFANGQPGDH